MRIDGDRVVVEVVAIDDERPSLGDQLELFLGRRGLLLGELALGDLHHDALEEARAAVVRCGS